MASDINNIPTLWIYENEKLSIESLLCKRKIYKGYFMDREVAVIKVEKGNESVSPLLNLQTEIQEVNSEDRKPTEFEILRRLSHQYIIRQFDFQHDRDFIYIPMELCDKNLEEYCMNLDYDKTKRLNILEQIGKGIEYLHNLKNPIVHGDLKPRNILIINNDGNNVTAKIADFRTSVEEESNFANISISSNDECNLYSKPPEALQVPPDLSDTGQSGEVLEVKVTRKWDIYAYGCLIQTVLTKYPTNMHPYGDMTDNRLVIVRTRKHSLKDESETDLFLLADLAIDDATVEDSWKRPCITTLLNHPMFWNMADKELFIIRITIDYILSQGLANSEKEFQSNFEKAFEAKYEGSWAEKIRPWNKSLVGEKKSRPEYSTRPSNLCTLIRNTCEHFYMFKEKYEIEAPQKNTEEFITLITETFPYLIKFLFVAYREHRDASKDDYNDYFRRSVECSGSC